MTNQRELNQWIRSAIGRLPKRPALTSFSGVLAATGRGVVELKINDECKAMSPIGSPLRGAS